MKKKNLKLTDFSKVLVAYYYEPDQLRSAIKYTENGPEAILEVVKGEKRGVVVSLGEGIFGWSMCKTKPSYTSRGWEDADTFNKEVGLSIALNRANIASALDVDGRASFYEKIPFTLAETFNEMVFRASKYFNYKEV